ncbi:glycosyltransferase family 9 protein [Desulfobaculum bizertense]|uniref:glycosyltransferase family 9 protein n=1 Tax=Desulfobaculum bizertense TaxID=376490 RepID=UPI001F1EF18E|nr:glycosyltransferase family 9 protein [Desulfobaculum bizertense]UIJ36974.1 glycosyltransferase family 9 protein [Desulfobaculum bizertense]
MKKPLLVIQPLRMGDLILSFPLFLWLSRKFPGHPIWVAAQQTFYEQLRPVGPAVQYFSLSHSYEKLRTTPYELVINLSHDSTSAKLAAEVKSEELFGPVCDAHGELHVRGFWQLYRCALVNCNRHNAFHWADLNAMDIIPQDQMQETVWSPPRSLGGTSSRRVGVFLGASEALKRPCLEFWEELCELLYARKIFPVLLGGPAEQAFATELASRLSFPALNLAGKQSLSELVMTGQGLNMLMTPDTGPMHLAAWSGLKVLNLSIGNVNCMETGPYQPGHYVLRPAMSCAGCWTCRRTPSGLCHRKLKPQAVAYLASQLCRDRVPSGQSAALAGLELWKSSRSEQGLYALEPCRSTEARSRALCSQFWQEFWLAFSGRGSAELPEKTFVHLREKYPALSERMLLGFARFGRDMNRILRFGSTAVQKNFWQQGAPVVSPLRSFAQMAMSNDNWSVQSRRDAVRCAEMLVSICQH